MTASRTFIGFSLLLLCVVQVALGQGIINNNPVPYGSCFNSTQDQLLLESETTTAQYVSVNVGIPFQTFFPFFLQGNLFPIWNPLFVNVSTQNLELCGPINAAYSNTPQVPFPPGMTGPHAIVQMGTDPTNMYGAFAWQFQLIAADGELLTWGRHTYLVQDLGDGSTNISSFEKVAGPQVDQYAYAWTVALEESLLDGVTGAICLERVYLATGDLEPTDVQKFCDPFKP